MKWYDYLLMFVGLVAPIAWESIKAANPDFPMPQEVFVNTVVYIFEAILGVRVFKVYLIGVAQGRGISYQKLIKGE
jgi:hypothetical protein